jgi:carotenoid cleavage dioxygenase
MLAFDPLLPYDGEHLGPPPFQFFNQLAHVNVETGETSTWFGGDAECFQEPIFVPRSKDAPEGDGFVIAVMNRLRTQSSELVILDSRDMRAGPVARVKVPFRLRMSLHGNWSPAE